ncbi:hypothetical protein EUX98_g9601 [Antrodiella citrinella]|uniref:Uncharacterized protein n=1 Tax=Antrodiella citrinella TaxID=2447956 RepID=A0A4S4LW35_9APHY|nr:hypothetical protein EUX98_g9601 [Antrodiella citrinella]
MDEPAERLEVNPYEQRCPDFTSAAFRGIRETMLAAQPDADPVAQMIAAWEAGNTNDKITWDAQVEADRVRREAEEREPQDPPGAPPVDEEPPLPSNPNDVFKFVEGTKVRNLPHKSCPYARSRLKDRKYIELFYFTLTGMKLTKISNASFGEGYGLVSTTDGLQFKSLTDLKAYKKVVHDENLSWSEVAQARSVLLHEMNTMGYPDAILNSFHAFFYNLEMHSVRHKTYGEQILVQYQADVRREFYDRLEQKRELFDIAIIDEAVMMQCEDKVRDRVEADRAATFARVRVTSCSNVQVC